MAYIIKGKTDDWELVIGLEVHCQILSNTKLFSGSSAEFGAKPNDNVSFYDAAFPGFLPVMNIKCAEQAVKTGFGLNATINKVSYFDRKNYFYADLPSGYQITQMFYPVVTEGYIEINTQEGAKKIRVNRLHIEQDAGKLIHDRSADKSFVDLNRAGVGLMEIVSYPDLTSPEDAGEYLKKLRSIVRYLGTCDGNMDEGSMRCDANVSVRKTGEKTLRTRVEIKNVNSIRFVMQAIETEAKRQIRVYESGGEITQETRLFDSDKLETRAMRSKEYAHDYRYYPDPDIPPLVLTDEFIDNIRKNLPELPDVKKQRYINELNLSVYDADVLTAERETTVYFEKAAAGRDAKKVANWIMGDLFALLKNKGLEISESPVSPEHLGELVGMINDNIINTKIAKDIFIIMAESGESPLKIAEERGLKQSSDTGIVEKAVDEIIKNNPDKVSELLGGKDKLMGWFVGQVMKATQGKANPAAINEIISIKLNALKK